MRHASLFTGIGGFDLAAEWMGWENVFQVEKDKRCLNVLKQRFPNTKRYNDAKSFYPITHGYNNTIDILTGGDPCQPNSNAGLRKGKDDDRFLWPEMFRVARELNVPWIVNENVSGSISNGILDLKIDDLESAGYTCQAYCIPAEAVGALHQRERVWLIAYNPDSYRDCKITREVFGSEIKAPKLEKEQHEVYQPWEPVNLWPANSDPDLQRWEEYHVPTYSQEQKKGSSWHARYFGFGPNAHGHIHRDIIESGIMGMLNGLPKGMDYADRGQRIKELGNSIVPQVAHEIFKAIDQVMRG